MIRASLAETTFRWTWSAARTSPRARNSPVSARAPRSVAELRREDIHGLDRGRVREQLGCLCHEGGGDLAGKMRLPTRIVRERVKDSECGRSQSQSEPDCR